MTSENDDSADDERSLFAKILRRSADELEEPTDDGDGPDVEQREGDEDDDEADETEEAADPIDRALSEGTIEAAQAGKLRNAAERMGGDPEPVIEEVAEGNLDTDRAVEILESAGSGDDEMPEPEDDEPVEERGEEPDDGSDETPDEQPIAELRERLDSLAEMGDRLDDIESRLDELPTEEDVEEEIAQRLETVGETLDEEFEDLIQRADITGSPHPKTGETSDTPLSDSLKSLRGES